MAEVIILGLSLYLAYKIYKKYGKNLESHIEYVLNNWPDIPSWLNCILGFSLFIGCVFVQITIFFESVVIWLVLLIIAPFAYSLIKNIKIYNTLSTLTFLLTTFFAITLFFSVDNSRDIIGKSFIPNYNVHYTVDDEREVEVAHINTGSKTLDFTLESIFPYIYRISIGLIIVFSLLMNISLKEKNKLIKKAKK